MPPALEPVRTGKASGAREQLRGRTIGQVWVGAECIIFDGNLGSAGACSWIYPVRDSWDDLGIRLFEGVGLAANHEVQGYGLKLCHFVSAPPGTSTLPVRLGARLARCSSCLPRLTRLSQSSKDEGGRLLGQAAHLPPPRVIPVKRINPAAGASAAARRRPSTSWM